MGIKTYNPTTPGSRGKVSLAFKELSKTKPTKTLVRGKSSISGRDGQGRISVRRRGGGHKRKYRLIDTKRNKLEVKGVVKTLEYDPNRSAFISLVHYADGEKRYILGVENLAIGSTIMASEKAKPTEGNALPLSKINVGFMVHNIEVRKGRGGQMVRSAGAGAKILGQDGNYVSIELPSGEVKLFHGDCFATVGVLANKDNRNIKLGKAGASRHRGKRPKVRGVVMNPVDHPMGGGEGRSSGGRHPCSPKGVPSKGFRTRRPKKYSNRFILRRRKQRR